MSKKPTITTITAGHFSAPQINANLEALRDAFDNTVSLDGSVPNAMGNDLDLNSNDVINGGTANFTALEVGGVDYLSLMQAVFDNYELITQSVTVSTSSPTGGSDGDIWFKVSS
jgi:hypothetical protein